MPLQFFSFTFGHVTKLCFQGVIHVTCQSYASGIL